MNLLRNARLFAAMPVLALSVLAGAAHADEVLVSSFPGGVVKGLVNAELIVDAHCIIAPGAVVNGNIKQPDAAASWNITIRPRATINGDVIDVGGGSVTVTVGPGQFFDDNILEEGGGSVNIHVFDGGLFDGNVEEKGHGSVGIVVNGSGLFNGNTYENDAGNLITSGTGMYNGSTKETGDGFCANFILNFNGNPCE